MFQSHFYLSVSVTCSLNVCFCLTFICQSLSPVVSMCFTLICQSLPLVISLSVPISLIFICQSLSLAFLVSVSLSLTYISLSRIFLPVSFTGSYQLCCTETYLTVSVTHSFTHSQSYLSVSYDGSCIVCFSLTVKC